MKQTDSPHGTNRHQHSPTQTRARANTVDRRPDLDGGMDSAEDRSLRHPPPDISHSQVSLCVTYNSDNEVYDDDDTPSGTFALEFRNDKDEGCGHWMTVRVGCVR